MLIFNNLNLMLFVRVIHKLEFKASFIENLPRVNPFYYPELLFLTQNKTDEKPQYTAPAQFLDKLPRTARPTRYSPDPKSTVNSCQNADFIHPRRYQC